MRFLRDNCEPGEPLLRVRYEPFRYKDTSAIVWAEAGRMTYDSTVMRVCTDARVQAIIAHELGHIRSHCDPDTDQKDVIQCEEEAHRYAELWGYRCVDNIYKTDECDELDKIARHDGINYHFFYAHCDYGHFLAGEALQSRLDVTMLYQEPFDDFEDARDWLKYRKHRLKARSVR